MMVDAYTVPVSEPDHKPNSGAPPVRSWFGLWLDPEESKRLQHFMAQQIPVNNN